MSPEGGQNYAARYPTKNSSTRYIIDLNDQGKRPGTVNFDVASVLMGYFVSTQKQVDFSAPMHLVKSGHESIANITKTLEKGKLELTYPRSCQN